MCYHSDLVAGVVVESAKVGLAVVDIAVEEVVVIGVVGGVAEVPGPMTIDLSAQEIAVGVQDGFLALQ